MIVYRIGADLITGVQWFSVADKTVVMDLSKSPTHLVCQPRSSTWTPPEVYVVEPLLAAGDFYDLNLTGQVILSPLCRHADAVRRFFRESGETLPIFHEGRTYEMLNVLQCINCLDGDRSEWLCMPDGRRIFPEKTAFYPERITGPSIFKIPELRAANLTVDRAGSPETDFKAAYDHYGLTGLVFKPIWEG